MQKQSLRFEKVRRFRLAGNNDTSVFKVKTSKWAPSTRVSPAWAVVVCLGSSHSIDRMVHHEVIRTYRNIHSHAPVAGGAFLMWTGKEHPVYPLTTITSPVSLAPQHSEVTAVAPV